MSVVEPFINAVRAPVYTCITTTGYLKKAAKPSVGTSCTDCEVFFAELSNRFACVVGCDVCVGKHVPRFHRKSALQI